MRIEIHLTDFTEKKQRELLDAFPNLKNASHPVFYIDYNIGDDDDEFRQIMGDPDGDGWGDKNNLEDL